MKKIYSIIIIILLTLTSCSNNSSDLSKSLTSRKELQELAYKEVYAYEISGMYIDAASTFSPCSTVDDVSAYINIRPIFALRCGEIIVYLTNKKQEENCYPIGDMYAVCDNKTVLENFMNTLVTLEQDTKLTVLSLPEVSLSEAATQDRINSILTGYDASDVIMYAIVYNIENNSIAVCKKDLGYTTEIVYIDTINYTYDLLNNESVLLIENTGEVISLEWYLNPNYEPVTDVIH